MAAERAWAYAMDIKNEMEQSNAPKKRHRMIRRLTKAHIHAKELVALASSCCDTRSGLEAEAYSAWMTGTLFLEKGKAWNEALSHFHHAKSLLNELFKVSDYDRRTNIRYLLEQVEPAVRFCEYQLNRSGKSAKLETMGSGTLASKLESLAAENEVTQGCKSVSEIEWNEETYPIRDERCKIKVLGAQQLVTGVDEELSSFDGLDWKQQEEKVDTVIQMFDKAINAYEDARTAARSASQLGTMSEEQQMELLALERALHGLEVQLTIRRNRTLARALENRLMRSIKRKLLPGKQREKSEKPARPEELVRIYDTLISNVTSLNDLAAELGGARGEVLMDLCSAMLSQFQAMKCYFIAHKYYADGLFEEAYSLFQRTEARCASARSALDECVDTDEGAKEDVERIFKYTKAFKVAAQAEQISKAIAAENAAAEGVRGMSIADSNGKRPRESDCLLDNLESWQSFAGDGKGPAKISKVPPVPDFIRAGQIVLDLALMGIKPPSLDHRIAKKPAGSTATGMVSRLFGW